MLFLISLRNGHPHHLFLPLSYFIHSMPSPPEDRLVNLSSYFSHLYVYHHPSHCWEMQSKTEAMLVNFSSYISCTGMMIKIQPYLYHLFKFSKCCEFTLEVWSYWSPKLGKWATVQLALHQFYEFSMLTQFAADFDHALQSVGHSHQKFLPLPSN